MNNISKYILDLISSNNKIDEVELLNTVKKNFDCSFDKIEDILSYLVNHNRIERQSVGDGKADYIST